MRNKMCYRKMYVTSFTGSYVDKEGNHDLVQTISGNYESKERLERSLKLRYPNFKCKKFTSYYAKVSVLLDDYVSVATYIERVKND